MTINKLTLCPLLLVALLFAGYPSLSMAEKLTCDVTDAPNVDLTTITASLETRINTLTQLASDLQRVRADLQTAATKEKIGVILLNFSATVKAASAIILSAGIATSATVAASPGVFAATVLSSTANFINDAINSQGSNQNEILLNALKSYGAGNIDLIGGKLTELAKNPIFGSSWSALSYSYTAVTNIIDLSKTWDSNTNLRGQIVGIDKQLKTLGSKIAILKNQLSKMNSLIAADETKVDNGFISIIEKYKNKNSCSQCDKPPVKVGNLEVQSCDYNQCTAKFWDGGDRSWCTWVEAMAGAVSYGSGWHLPTKGELFTLWINRHVVGGFAETIYWSGTELDSSLAWGEYFGNGGQVGTSKTDSYRVRAVRAY